MNPNTIYTAMQKRAWGTGASSSWTPAPAKPYSKPTTFKPADKAVQDTTANQSMFNSVGSNLKNWFGQKAWDIGHGIDTLFGTKTTYGTKRPTDQSYGGSFWNAINPFGTRPTQQQPNGNPHNLPTWRQRMMDEQKGNVSNIQNRNKYKQQIVLPGQDVFYGMAKQEATGKQYDKLRNAGYTPDQIANYVMQEKYLPLVREVTGRQNITPQMQLTDQHWAKIKDSMINRQMAGIDKNLMRPDPKTRETNAAYVRTAQNEQMYRDALSQAWDARTQALRNGQDPNKAEINYSDAIKNNKVMMGAINNAARNSW